MGKRKCCGVAMLPEKQNVRRKALEHDSEKNTFSRPLRSRRRGHREKNQF